MPPTRYSGSRRSHKSSISPHLDKIGGKERNTNTIQDEQRNLRSHNIVLSDQALKSRERKTRTLSPKKQRDSRHINNSASLDNPDTSYHKAATSSQNQQKSVSSPRKVLPSRSYLLEDEEPHDHDWYQVLNDTNATRHADILPDTSNIKALSPTRLNNSKWYMYLDASIVSNTMPISPSKTLHSSVEDSLSHNSDSSHKPQTRSRVRKEQKSANPSAYQKIFDEKSVTLNATKNAHLLRQNTSSEDSLSFNVPAPNKNLFKQKKSAKNRNDKNSNVVFQSVIDNQESADCSPLQPRKQTPASLQLPEDNSLSPELPLKKTKLGPFQRKRVTPKSRGVENFQVAVDEQSVERRQTNIREHKIHKSLLKEEDNSSASSISSPLVRAQPLRFHRKMGARSKVHRSDKFQLVVDKQAEEMKPSDLLTSEFQKSFISEDDSTASISLPVPKRGRLQVGSGMVSKAQKAHVLDKFQLAFNKQMNNEEIESPKPKTRTSVTSRQSHSLLGSEVKIIQQQVEENISLKAHRSTDTITNDRFMLLKSSQNQGTPQILAASTLSISPPLTGFKAGVSHQHKNIALKSRALYNLKGVFESQNDVDDPLKTAAYEKQIMEEYHVYSMSPRTKRGSLQHRMDISTKTRGFDNFQADLEQQSNDNKSMDIAESGESPELKSPSSRTSFGKTKVSPQQRKNKTVFKNLTIGSIQSAFGNQLSTSEQLEKSKTERYKSDEDSSLSPSAGRVDIRGSLQQKKKAISSKPDAFHNFQTVFESQFISNISSGVIESERYISDSSLSPGKTRGGIKVSLQHKRKNKIAKISEAVDNFQAAFESQVNQTQPTISGNDDMHTLDNSNDNSSLRLRETVGRTKYSLRSKKSVLTKPDGDLVNKFQAVVDGQNSDGEAIQKTQIFDHTSASISKTSMGNSLSPKSPITRARSGALKNRLLQQRPIVNSAFQNIFDHETLIDSVSLTNENSSSNHEGKHTKHKHSSERNKGINHLKDISPAKLSNNKVTDVKTNKLLVSQEVDPQNEHLSQLPKESLTEEYDKINTQHFDSLEHASPVQLHGSSPKHPSVQYMQNSDTEQVETSTTSAKHASVKALFPVETGSKRVSMKILQDSANVGEEILYKSQEASSTASLDSLSPSRKITFRKKPNQKVAFYGIKKQNMFNDIMNDDNKSLDQTDQYNRSKAEIFERELTTKLTESALNVDEESFHYRSTEYPSSPKAEHLKLTNKEPEIQPSATSNQFHNKNKSGVSEGNSQVAGDVSIGTPQASSTRLSHQFKEMNAYSTQRSRQKKMQTFSHVLHEDVEIDPQLFLGRVKNISGISNEANKETELSNRIDYTFIIQPTTKNIQNDGKNTFSTHTFKDFNSHQDPKQKDGKTSNASATFVHTHSLQTKTYIEDKATVSMKVQDSNISSSNKKKSIRKTASIEDVGDQQHRFVSIRDANGSERHNINTTVSSRKSQTLEDLQSLHDPAKVPYLRHTEGTTLNKTPEEMLEIIFSDVQPSQLSVHDEETSDVQPSLGKNMLHVQLDAGQNEENTTKVDDSQKAVPKSSESFTKRRSTLVHTPATAAKKASTPKQRQTSINSFFDTLPPGMAAKEFLAQQKQDDPHYAESCEARRKRVFEEREKRRQLIQEKLTKMNTLRQEKPALFKRDSIAAHLAKSETQKPQKEGQKPIRSEFLVNGKPWRAPKLRRPKQWVTNRLYDIVMENCRKRFGELSKRNRAELFVVRFCKVVSSAIRCKKNYEPHVQKAKIMLYKLGVIKTLNDFHVFIENYLPWEFRYKAIPTLRAFGVITGMKSDIGKNIFEDMKL